MTMGTLGPYKTTNNNFKRKKKTKYYCFNNGKKEQKVTSYKKVSDEGLNMLICPEI